MTNTYLLEVIKALQPSERQEMALFLASPLFNRGGNAEDLIRLFQIIIDAAPDFSGESLQKGKVYPHVFGDSTIVPGKLEKLMADLNKQIRNYSLIKRNQSETNEVQQQVDWAAWLRERGMIDRSKHILTKLKSQKHQEKMESLEYYRQMLVVSEEEHEWESIYNKAKGDIGIAKLIYQLDLFYYIYRMELTNRYLVQQKQTQLPNLEIFNSKIEFYYGESVLLQITRKVHEILILDLPSTTEFQQLMTLLNQNENHLPYQTKIQFYAFLRSSCTLLINSGHLDFIAILHEIHKDNLTREYFFINGEVPPNVYLNLVQVATRAKDYEWAKKFTNDYKGLIVGGDPEEFFYHLNMSLCFFGERKFEEALAHLPDVASGSHHHHIVRILEIKIYYELRSDLLLYKLDAFRKFTERTAPKTISTNLREMDLNFLNILLQLAQSPMKDKARSAKLIERIESKKLIADRAWLLEKAKELG